MNNGDCRLHENQRKAGTLCRSIHCSKCPPYRGTEEVKTVRLDDPEFNRELAGVFNRFSIDNLLDLPDYKISKLVIDILKLSYESKKAVYRPNVGSLKL